jgi:hypothetical protein
MQHDVTVGQRARSEQYKPYNTVTARLMHPYCCSKMKLLTTFELIRLVHSTTRQRIHARRKLVLVVNTIAYSNTQYFVLCYMLYSTLTLAAALSSFRSAPRDSVG